jgi:hypothetical protein
LDEQFARKQTNYLTMTNVSALDLNAAISTSRSEFVLVDNEHNKLTRELEACVRSGESLQVGVVFDTTFKRDLHNETLNGALSIAYAEHEHIVSIEF